MPRQTTRTASSTQRWKMRRSATGMAVGTVKMIRLRCLGLSESWRRALLAGELMLTRAWVTISPTMNIMREERVKWDPKSGSAGCWRRAGVVR